MTTRIPIYQMTYGRDEDGNTGLVFTSEQDEFSNQSILFTIPIFRESNHLIDFAKRIEMVNLYFPFELDGEYHELNAEINFPEFTFKVPNYKNKVTFIIDYESHFWPLSPYFYAGTMDNKYVGRHKNLLPRNRGFLSILPIDLYEMDQLYVENRGIFVGLTPKFGNTEVEY